MKPLVLLVCLAVLGACTANEVGNGLLGSAKSWCRNTQQNCSVSDEAR